MPHKLKTRTNSSQRTFPSPLKLLLRLAFQHVSLASLKLPGGLETFVARWVPPKPWFATEPLLAPGQCLLWRGNGKPRQGFRFMCTSCRKTLHLKVFEVGSRYMHLKIKQIKKKNFNKSLIFLCMREGEKGHCWRLIFSSACLTL